MPPPTIQAVPHLLLMKGHPATGKSSLARALARRLRWPLVDKDDAKDHLYHLPQGNQLAYQIAWQVTETQLGLGLSVIVDTPLSYPQGYATGQELAQRYRARLLVVETTLEEGEWRRRLAQRTDSPHRISSWAAMQALLARYDGCWAYPIRPEHHLRVETHRPVAELVEQVLQALEMETDDKMTGATRGQG